MAKTTKKTVKKKTVKRVSAGRSKKPKTTLVWKRSARGRPKKAATGARKPSARKKTVSVIKAAVPVPTNHRTISPRHHTVGGPASDQRTSELIVEQSKFQLGPKQNAGDFTAHNIPFEYGKNRIVLLVVDPKFAFIYWEVQTDRMHSALQSLGHNAKLTLRFHEADRPLFWDISIYERVGNWYLKLDHPQKHLWVELGMKNDRGDFHSIARSHQIKMPRTGLAAPGPIKWMLVSPTGEKVMTEVEEYTDADYELLKKILGPYFFDLFRKGKFAGIAGSSAENIFMELTPPSISS